MPKNDPLFSFKWEGRAVGANHQFADKRSKRLNPEYARFMHEIRANSTWLQEAIMGGSVPLVFVGELWLRINMHIDKARDWESLLKPLCDGLEYWPTLRMGIIKNDRQIRGASIMTFPHKRGEPDRIEVKAYDLDGET